MFDIESAIESWKRSFGNNHAIGSEEALELESHLRDLTTELCQSGLSEREAFMIGTMRLGHPSELECEFAKISPAAHWQRRVLWMLTGYIAMTVGGAIISTMVAIAGTGVAILGLNGTATGVAMLAVLALGWIGLLVLIQRHSQNTSTDRNRFSFKWGVAAVALLMLSPLLTGSGGVIRAKYVAISHLGESAMVYSFGGWAIHLGVCIACLLLIRKLSQTAYADASTIS
ncbi:hypothetical protein [Aureliella helgolandensis]|uniref:DUF1129 family protein n=1 Tax=Aureliella helgolandensis TaxID=2527968 RepID=A0A518GG79_9BACT|nr:hypothetical protein [Aureliella helgolandensis]QDV27580.1 hypothetical protein Q31a_59720 [Aureliella helgolandensis]